MKRPLTRTDHINSYLKLGEKVSSTILTEHDERTRVKFLVHTIDRQGLEPGDEVILEVWDATEPCVLVGGNPLEIEVLSGMGWLCMVDLPTGTISDTPLNPGDRHEIPTNNVLYSYGNASAAPLIIRDHCDGFDPENEPSLEAVADALAALSLKPADKHRPL